MRKKTTMAETFCRRLGVGAGRSASTTTASAGAVSTTTVSTVTDVGATLKQGGGEGGRVGDVGRGGLGLLGGTRGLAGAGELLAAVEELASVVAAVDDEGLDVVDHGLHPRSSVDGLLSGVDDNGGLMHKQRGLVRRSRGAGAAGVVLRGLGSVHWAFALAILAASVVVRVACIMGKALLIVGARDMLSVTTEGLLVAATKNLLSRAAGSLLVVAADSLLNVAAEVLMEVTTKNSLTVTA